ncbi:single-stranded DNA-binding protein [Marisediminicola sp. LYQ134]|uniref:single-stranded DNA-binding protein n=1 Tax=unclassified Marisediminicola TaxID=2618316 RepID=UPI003982E75B
MTDTITIAGVVGTVPRHVLTGAGLAITSFRLASTQRRFDRAQNKWVDGDTNWFTVTTFRQLALNVATSVSKGDRVVVLGRVRLRDWRADDKSGTTVEIEADSLGHDLAWGSAVWSRSTTNSGAGESTPSAAPHASAGGGGAPQSAAAHDAPASVGSGSGEGAAQSEWATASLGDGEVSEPPF